MDREKLMLLFIIANYYCLGINAQVSDGRSDGARDNESTAQTAILVTAIVCAIAAMLCVGACGFCFYQKCCVEDCVI